LKTQVLIIGGGVTGAGLARDLALRGVHCIIVEQQDFNAGASGGNHGLLHSGARYVSSDPDTACECHQESERLKRLAPQCVEETGGLFVAVEGDDEAYIADFPQMCRDCGIRTTMLAPEAVQAMEPALSPKLIAAYQVADASIDPFKLTLDNISHAQDHGTVFRQQCRVVAFARQRNRIKQVKLVDTLSGQPLTIRAEQVVNAGGAWAGEVAALAGIDLPMVYSKGSLLVTHGRITQQVINRLRHPTDGDILVPGGTVSILGTTSVRIAHLKAIAPTIEEVDLIIDEGAAMLPVLEDVRYIRAYAGIRPLTHSTEAHDDRSVSRGFVLVDHARQGVNNFTTITGGKLTTYRVMAEKTADLICSKLGVTAPCRTNTEALPASAAGKWTEPGLAPRTWLHNRDPQDLLLCECEMVSQSTVDSIIRSIRDQNGRPSLKAIGLRSRLGKGPCQGAFCGLRAMAYLYDQQQYTGTAGMADLKAFLSARWRGQKPLMWGMPLVQAELQEAVHCGLLGLELTPP
jgi:glycerol-3-phosphate dehydrogenase